MQVAQVLPGAAHSPMNRYHGRRGQLPDDGPGRLLPSAGDTLFENPGRMSPLPGLDNGSAAVHGGQGLLGTSLAVDEHAAALVNRRGGQKHVGRLDDR